VVEVVIAFRLVGGPMRTASLLPLGCVAVLIAACGSEVPGVPEREETAARAAEPRPRDLTLQVSQLPPAEVASPVELARPYASPATTRTPRPRPRPKPQPAAEPENAPAVVPTALPVAPAAPILTEALGDPAPVDDAGSGGRELAPGKTVTVIPVSSGPTLEADEDDSWLPSEQPRGIIVGGGDRCRRRGGVRGIGIAGRIPVGIPARRLR
jgi:hypothetical protein